MSTQGLWHYPAVITNATIAQTFATFAPDSGGSVTTTSTAAIINNFSGRQQMVWFTSWATDWAQTSNFLQHAFIHWMTRGLCKLITFNWGLRAMLMRSVIVVGKRKVYLNTQVDDMHLETDMYLPANTTFRIRTTDLDTHKTWQSAINGRLPSGSNYVIELGHNGNGDIETATDLASSANICKPDYAVEYDSPPDTPLEFQKPLGTGTDLWPPEFTNYTWSLSCAKLDKVASWFANNVNTFAAVSHTFTHEELNNATYHDASREIYFNIAWLKQIGLYSGNKFSPNGIIPPAITGLHNGDAIKAWMDNGIKYVVGDNTRPVLRNQVSLGKNCRVRAQLTLFQQNSFWPLITTVAANGYAGLVIVPRWGKLSS